MGYYIDSRGKKAELKDEEAIFLYHKNIVELNLSDHIKLKMLIIN